MAIRYKVDVLEELKKKGYSSTKIRNICKGTAIGGANSVLDSMNCEHVWIFVI